ncbi:hypothetical protein BN946_scf184843.g7 [Trametes cinnabarina]|uniref:RING-type domain-containing protein n=1 Tax=Pycnoporus cinnabarinus TaxID=5643 RepID=A0A060SD77_PYCCI|nr:hypothetical protein BN946_scf184843.g7 [Trametes cinnabarina]
MPPNAPLSSEPHGISCTLVPPTPPPTSPNFGANFASAQAKPKASGSKLSGGNKSNSEKVGDANTWPEGITMIATSALARTDTHPTVVCRTHSCHCRRSLFLLSLVPLNAAMDAAAQQIVHESTDSFYNASMFFNVSLKLAHRFLSLPSRALARLRRLDDLTLELHEAAQQSPYAAVNGNGQRRSRSQVSNGPPIPGMWGFLTSGYFLGLFIMTTWTQLLIAWVAEKKMEDICWYTFLSACAALCIGTLTTGLEGLNMNDSSPFNLFAFAFQLYVCAASHTYATKEGEAPSRPNVHVIVTILLPLLQLVVMHCLEVKHRWTQYRLIVSTTIALLALIHFHSVVWFFPHAYPLTTYAARVVESIMIVVIGFTVGLNAMTQLLLDGAITRPLIGHSAILPRWDEDFNVALFRLGTASMDATAVAGLGNEVGGVASARPAFSAVTLRKVSQTPELVRGELELDRAGVAGLSPAFEERGTRRVVRKGFANEIAGVKAKAASTDFWMNTVLNVAWQRHLGAFLASTWRAAVRVWDAGIACLKRRASSKKSRERSAPSEVVVLDGVVLDVRRPSTEDPYKRFLRGEDVSDDEDDEFNPDDQEDEAGETPATLSDDDEDEANDAGVVDVEDYAEQAELFADLSTSAAQAASAPLLLAHMTDTSPSPLTRRGYKRLVSGSRHAVDSDDWEGLEEFVLERRRIKRAEAEAKGEDAFAEQTRNCVICTVEARDIICWPCRCLALCDDCRENLASRSSASKHTCPCCRRSVEGYSKIYIP